MKKNYTKGFTLIELLVVIAIIGILASVVLASLNSARAKGADAAIKAGLDNSRAQAELWYDGNPTAPQTYIGVCQSANATGTPAGIYNIINQASATAGAGPLVTALATAEASNTSVCHETATGDKWAAQVPMKAVAGTYYCVDSTGLSKTETAVMAGGATACL